MKKFTDYLMESQKTYEFKIKLAGDVDNETVDKLETALKKYDMSSISGVKRLPIQDCSIDFPNIGPCQINLIDVVLSYPVNDEQLRQVIHDGTGVPLSNILVVPQSHPEEQWREEAAARKESGKKEAILTQDYEKNTEKPAYGDEYNKKMLKDIPTRKYEFAAKSSEKGKTTNDLPVGQKGPLGTHKPKMVDPKKLRK